MITCITGDKLEKCPYPHCGCVLPGSEVSKQTWYDAFLQSEWDNFIVSFATVNAGPSRKRGNFVWSDDGKTVDFVEHENGTFILAYDPYKQD